MATCGRWLHRLEPGNWGENPPSYFKMAPPTLTRASPVSHTRPQKMPRPRKEKEGWAGDGRQGRGAEEIGRHPALSRIASLPLRHLPLRVSGRLLGLCWGASGGWEGCRRTKKLARGQPEAAPSVVLPGPGLVRRAGPSPDFTWASPVSLSVVALLPNTNTLVLFCLCSKKMLLQRLCTN